MGGGPLLIPDHYGFVSRGMQARATLKPPAYVPPKEHHITVDCRTGDRKVIGLPDPWCPAARHILVDPARSPFRALTPRSIRIIEAVCTTWCISPETLGRWHSGRAKVSIILPRFACWRMLTQKLHCSTPTIGRMFRRDRTTIFKGLKRASELYHHNLDWRAKYDAALEAMEQS